ncbi:MAG: multidrug efflux system membrane fusion protein [Cyclobacteriaceae bacterium]|jgi:multidrug efflux system membrane fusion protein
MKGLTKLLTITFMTVLLASFMSCSDTKQAEKAPIRPVRYTTASLTGSEKSKVFSGTTVSQKTIGLSFRQTGKITKLNIKVGQKVQKGQLLAQLDNIQSRLALEQGQAQQNAAESNMNTAKLSLERVMKLYEKGSASLSDLEQAKNGFQTAEKGFEAAEKGVAILNEQLAYGHIYALNSGTIAALLVEEGENVGAGQPVGVLNSGGPMEINLGIPEGTINEVQAGMLVDVTYSSLESKIWKGKVTEVAPANRQSSATYLVVVELINPDASIKSGMAANVSFSFNKEDKIVFTLMVPTSAVGEDSEGQFVFLIQEDDNIYRVKKQQVEIGGLSADGFEILSGLAKGQYVATAGLQTLLHNQEVKLKN